MIHAQRRYEGKADCTVFGLSTDNEQFHFLRINNKGEEIVETIAYFHKYTSALSVCNHISTSENAWVEDGIPITKGSDARINELEQIQRSEKKLETAHENDKLKNVLERYRDR
ncbi:hypothetical protein LT330_003092 [Penicillium expansum]|nr:hypothetical protein LT330_003092 [Penicillium expansum]